MNLSTYRFSFRILPVFCFLFLLCAPVQAANVTLDCEDSGNCSDVVYDNHKGTISAQCAASATESDLPVKITVNGDVYTGTLDCSGGEPVIEDPSVGEWVITGPGACTQACGGGQQFFDVTCPTGNCPLPKPAESQECNVQACDSCDPDQWFGDDPADICVGQVGVETNECGDERNVSGTWDPQDWAPSTSVVCSFENFYQGTSCGADREIVGTLDCQPTWHWLRPAPPGPMLSANPSSDYNNLRVSGDLFYIAAGKGFFEINDIKSARVVLLEGLNQREYLVDLDTITFTDRSYEFFLDMAELQKAVPVGASEPIALPDGDWGIDVMFEHKHSGMADYQWIRNSVSGEFVLDSTPPVASFTHRQTGAATAELMAEDRLTNKPGWLWMHCDDVGPAGCLGDLTDLDADSLVDNYQPYPVKGNFCDDESRCNTVGIRSFEICDLVDNCAGLDVTLDNYDPIAPGALNFGIQLSPAGEDIDESEIKTILKASADYYPVLTYVDPDSVTIATDVPSIEISTAKILEEEFENLFDAHTCGDPEDSPFTLDTGLGACILENPNYPPTCDDESSCPDPCPAGYFWDSGNGICQPFESCTDVTWTPNVDTMCEGTDFPQVSNCGNRRDATGTKDCSATGNWRVTAPSACSTECGQPANTQTGSVSCPTSDCDPATEPEVPTTSCAATVTCEQDKVFEENWQTVPAPNCPTACGQPASTQTGSVNCSGKNSDCDPATKPEAPATNCRATAACSPEFDAWTVPSAPSCPTSCGYPGGAVTGEAVYCEAGNNCDGSSKPSAATKNCSATSACEPVTTCTSVDWDFDGWCEERNGQPVPMCENFNLHEQFCNGDPDCAIRNLNRISNTCAFCKIEFDRCNTYTPVYSEDSPDEASAPLYTGTWTVGAAPACSADSCVRLMTGSVTCSNGNCDPSTRPEAATRNCNTSIACEARRSALEAEENPPARRNPNSNAR